MKKRTVVFNARASGNIRLKLTDEEYDKLNTIYNENGEVTIDDLVSVGYDDYKLFNDLDKIIVDWI